MKLAFSRKTSSKKITLYDEKGRTTTEKNYAYPGNKWVDSLIYHYNFSHDTISAAWFVGKNEIGDSSVYIYNKGGKISQAIYYSQDLKKIDLRKIYVYENNLLIADTEFNSSRVNAYTQIQTYQYDSSKNISRMSKETKYGNSIVPDRYEYEYHRDSLGNDTLEVTFHFNPIMKKSMDVLEKKFIARDGYGNIISMTLVDANGKTLEKYKVKYIYDVKGNWIKKTLIYDRRKYYPHTGQRRKNIIIRKIEYY